MNGPSAQGLQILYADLLHSTGTGMALFEQLCAISFFHVPAHVLLRPALEPLLTTSAGGTSSSEAEEQEADRKLEGLRAQLAQVGIFTASLSKGAVTVAAAPWQVSLTLL